MKSFLDILNAKVKGLKENNGFMRYFNNTSWIFGEKILRIIVGLFVAVWLARYLGVEDYGSFSYVLSVVGLLGGVASLGLDNIVVKELVKGEIEENKILGTAFLLKLIGGGIVFILLTVMTLSISIDNEISIMIVVVAFVNIFLSINVIEFYFQSNVLSKYTVIANVISLSISNLLKVILIISEAPLISFVWPILFEAIIFGFGLGFFYRKIGNDLNFWQFDRELGCKLLKASWPLVITAFSASLYMKIDQVMIEAMMGVEGVGIYAAAVRLSEAVYFIPIVIASSLFPAIINSRNKNVELYLERLQNLYRLVVWIAIVIAVIITYSAEYIIDILYGQNFQAASDVLIIHIWASIFVFLNAAFAKFLYAESYEIKYLYRSVFGATINILLNYFLIKRFGVQGAAVATLSSLFLMNYVFDLFDPDLRPLLKMKIYCFLPNFTIK